MLYQPKLLELKLLNKFKDFIGRHTIFSFNLIKKRLKGDLI